MTRTRINGIARAGMLAAAIAAGGPAAGQAIERVRADDAGLDCPGIARESGALDPVIAAGQSSALAKTTAGTAANVGGQVAGAAVAQGVGGFFGALGGVVSQVTGAVAQQAAESQVEPDAPAKERARQAQARKDFLARLSAAKECSGDSAGAGKPLGAEQFQQLAAAPAPGQPLASLTPLTPASVEPVLREPVRPLPAAGLLDGTLDLRGKRFYVAEFRLLFDVGGTVSANTRGGYLPGRDYGSTRSRTSYAVAGVDVAAFQAITDAAWADLRRRLSDAGARLEDAEAFVRENGAVYATTEEASRPGAPVFLEKSLGHSARKYLVMAPTGMKLHPRGFGGLGAGDIGKRIDWSKGGLEGLSITLAVNIAALESSGSGSSIAKRGSSTSAGAGMTVGQGPDAFVVQTHANTMAVRMEHPLPLDGSFARFRETGGWDSDKDAAGRTMGILTNMAGMGANKSKRVDLEVELDGAATARMALQGVGSLNAAIAERIGHAIR